MDKPKVTIITATYNLIKNNRKDYFLQMVDSVKNQTYSDIEHLIIDGGSDDGSIELFKELGLNYISQKDEGIYDAYNKGINLAKGKYINFLNSDDFFCNRRAVELSVNALEKTNAVFSCSAVNILDKNDNIKEIFKPKMYNVLSRNPFCHQSMFTKTSVLKNMGGFNLKYEYASDYDLIIKLVLKKEKYAKINDILVSFRQGGVSYKNPGKYCMERIEIYKNIYSDYINITQETAQKILITGCAPLELLIKAKITNIEMYYFLFKYNFVKLKRRLFSLFTKNKKEDDVFLRPFTLEEFIEKMENSCK